MQRLQRVLASSVLRALSARDHVVISAASADAITDEMEAVIAPALVDITPHLSEVGEAMSSIDTGRFSRADLDLDASGKAARERGADDPPSRGAPSAVARRRGKALRVMVDRITERLLESDHVDDIHADDDVLRRDAFRAIRRILFRYIHGDLDVEDDVPDEETCFTVVLERLGYVVCAVAERLDPAMLEEALERAAATSEGELLWLDARTFVAAFDTPGGPTVSRLTLEEAITEELVGLVDTELVELPCVQQVLELDQVTCDAPGFDDAVERAEARIRAESGSAASCARVDDQTVVATFTPLSEDAAERADEHFASFLSALEHELSALSGQGHDGHDAGDGVHDARKPASSGRRRRKRHTTDEPPASSKKVPLQQGKRAKRAKRGATKSPKSKKAPASEPRGKRAPTERSSETRSRNARGNKKKTRRNG